MCVHSRLYFFGAVSRSLTGHRSNCLSLAFTANDTNQLVSGSLDCNVKVWDLRRKEAITTFKGHKKGVMKVAPSPDNKWVCSGSEDGELKVGWRNFFTFKHWVG
jgi:katanin p80 WD40 repeat-containing subunit B1